jgi:hypothetical protein
MKYTVRLYKSSWNVAYLFEPKKEVIHESVIEIDESPTIGNIRDFFKKEFGFTIDDYGSREIELAIEGVCRLSPIKMTNESNIDKDTYPENKNVINIYLREEEYKNWKSFNRDRNINKIIN